MTYFPQPHPKRRSARADLDSIVTATLRFEDGRHSRGKLRTISRTGGLLQLSKPRLAGTLVEVTFMSRSGPVHGLAELLNPVSATLKCLQPFKFIMFDDADYRRLDSLIITLLMGLPVEAPALPTPYLWFRRENISTDNG
jgi:hypothetical protein